MNMKMDRRSLIEMLGGASAFAAMSATEKADAVEQKMAASLETPAPGATATSIQKVTGDGLPDPQGVRTVRPGGGRIFGYGKKPTEVLAPMPDKPTLQDFFQNRFLTQRKHVLQSAGRAMKSGGSEELVLACLLHDVAQELIVVDHGWWGGQLMAPYVSEKVSWAITYHQALRFFPDDSVGYKYPEFYNQLFGPNYVPEPYIRQAYEYARKHKWYMEARMITVNDYYAFDPKVEVSLDPFVDIIGRHFKQPAAGLGYDGSPVAHMWRSLIYADHPL